ncbi:S41 family peptidase [Croceicoccus hydrothermalis]|uniref:S41 family peptidase n=1 Tax=Croceicoccus hydrothermalis TaxID=2867964 RepID=UPI001EFA645B|nr:PDZ domain-containing protein [Croceicoccus hydrothermalis]
MKLKALPSIIFAPLLLAGATEPVDYNAAAADLDQTIERQYAYLDKLPDGTLPQSDVLTREREAVHDERTLLRYAEHRIASLADHHAITGSSFADSWAVVPTYADLWVVFEDGRYVIDAVRPDSPASQAGIQSGQQIAAIDGVPVARAVAGFWSAMDLEITPQRAGYAARVLVAGRRDRERRIVIADSSGTERPVVLSSLYAATDDPEPPLSVCAANDVTIVRFNNALGDRETIAAFDAAMGSLNPDTNLVLDLRDTPSGGNTTIARAIMGWFVDRPRDYQIHNRPVEERETGVARQWIEQVLPRSDKYRSELPTILVGRWTGSMGEGLAIGFAALGADVRGSMMAGLNGSVEDLPIGNTDLTIKLPTERLMTTEGKPREDFVPAPIGDRLANATC